jgi:hypothetical protein
MNVWGLFNFDKFHFSSRFRLTTTKPGDDLFTIDRRAHAKIADVHVDDDDVKPDPHAKKVRKIKPLPSHKNLRPDEPTILYVSFSA